jgi:NAD(P)-dependent dehydrogenase (short-subunit alcohol dehydrogenase family)
MRRLESKVAVVTGASRGVGRGIALALGEQGATVYVTARSVRGASSRPYLPGTTVDDTAEQVDQRGGTGIPVPCDHTDQSQIEALLKRVEREQGRLDILVNNTWGRPQDFEVIAVFLASDASRFVTGQIVYVDGGWLATF